MKNGQEVINWIHSLLPFGIKPGLARMEWLLERLDHPEKKINAVHIGGTNGKGSTVSYMKHVFMEAGYNVGTFTSPYIECFEERISINGEPIAEKHLVKCGNIIRPLVEELTKTKWGSPTEFEVITTIAFYYFATIAKPDIALIEVGLGGRFDSTNVITPILSVITSIGLDHTHILGDTIEEIAMEKAGIIKKDIPLITGVNQREVKALIQQTAADRNADYNELSEHFSESLIDASEAKQVFVFTNDAEEKLTCEIQMKGPHQRENAAVAIQAIKRLVNDGYYEVNDDEILKGLFKTTWLGRFEMISHDPIIIIDGAHNREGFISLAHTLQENYPNKNYRFIVAATEEKDMATLLKPLDKKNSSFTFTTFSFFRAAKAEELYKRANVNEKNFVEDWKEAIQAERESLSRNEMLIICGSLYFISEVRKDWMTNEENQAVVIRKSEEKVK